MLAATTFVGFSLVALVNSKATAIIESPEQVLCVPGKLVKDGKAASTPGTPKGIQSTRSGSTVVIEKRTGPKRDAAAEEERRLLVQVIGEFMADIRAIKGAAKK